MGKVSLSILITAVIIFATMVTLAILGMISIF